MSAKIFVGNFPYSTAEEDLNELFASFGEIEDARVIRDRLTGRSRGFGFITFADQSAADQAVTKMNDYEMDGRKLRVDHAQQKESA